MSEYKITIKLPSGEESELNADEDISILESAEDAGHDLPYSCRNGSCSSCTCKLISGSVNQEDQLFLNDEQISEGYFLSCVAKPLEDCVVETHKEEDME
ncbi:MAG: 2Fe-2S iron-sulfur cluster-binding protein [Crocinitomicaceae bacterium]|nr:2Fe-2S iron-sulfur cluster-binding protein [Crocinitomicaceae bacterium]